MANNVTTKYQLFDGKKTIDIWEGDEGPPEGDGEVLIIQIDSKATPTATEEELAKRRGKRPPNPHRGSQRHRGKDKRRRLGSKKRRKKGDKSKNGKMAPIVVMYTLRRSADVRWRALSTKRSMLPMRPSGMRWPLLTGKRTSVVLGRTAGS